MTKTLTTNGEVLAAARGLHRYGFNVIPCGRFGKDGSTWDFKAYPGKEYGHLFHDVQTEEALENEPWTAATGLAIVHGVGKIRAFDIDAVKQGKKVISKATFEAVQVLCTMLGLDPDTYEWIVQSGNGWHVWVLAEDMTAEDLDGDGGNITKKEFDAADGFKHGFGKLELRWKNHITVVPPSQHSEATGYKFKNCTFPSQPPAMVTADKVTAAVKVLCRVKPDPEIDFRKQERQPKKTPGAKGNVTADKIRSMLAVIPAEQEHITWKKTVAGVVDAIGKDDAIPLLEEWSPSEIPYGKVIDSGLDRVTFGTLVALAKQHGWQGEAEVTRAEQVQAFLLESFELQYNVLRRQVEYRAKDSDSWNIADDRTYEQWTVTFEKQSTKVVAVDKVRQYATDVEVCRPYDPIKEFFDKLEPWDGEDHITKLAGCVTLRDEDNRSTFELHVKKWLVGTYSCGYFGGYGGSKNELFLILQGAQSIGKTTFLRKVVPPELEPYKCERFDATKIEDVYSILSKSFLCIDEELASMTKKEVEKMKGLLSAETFEFRSAYGRSEVNHLRRVSYCGSVNPATFLRDQTGSRRFLVHSIEGVHRANLEQVNIRQVWAQAKAMHFEGFKHYLDPSETVAVQAMNTEYELLDQVEELLVEFFRPAIGNERGEWLTTTQIAERLAVKQDQKFGDTGGRLRIDSFLLNRLGALLIKRGFERRKVKIAGSVRQAYKVTGNVTGIVPPAPVEEDDEKPLF